MEGAIGFHCPLLMSALEGRSRPVAVNGPANLEAAASFQRNQRMKGDDGCTRGSIRPRTHPAGLILFGMRTRADDRPVVFDLRRDLSAGTIPVVRKHGGCQEARALPRSEPAVRRQIRLNHLVPLRGPGRRFFLPHLYRSMVHGP